MRRLVCEYYDGFSLGNFVKHYPHLRGKITDLLIGDLFTDKVDEVWAPMESLYPPEKKAIPPWEQGARSEGADKVNELFLPPGKLRELLAGFRYPWPPAAVHAANAVVELGDKSLASTLSKLKDDPDPQRPFSTEIQKKNGKQTILAKRELVRINHMCNCLLCHAPSRATTDMARGRVPIPNETPPPLYYAEKTGEVFARADTTFLRQDFSVMQPVANDGTWPGDQRFDYLARVRPLTKKETLEFEKLPKDQPMSFVQRDAVRFVLKELTAEVSEDTKPLKGSVTVPKKP